MTEIYSPLCTECTEAGDYSLATEVVEGPCGRQPACTKHYNAAGERGATRGELEDVSASERHAAAYTLDGRLR